MPDVPPVFLVLMQHRNRIFQTTRAMFHHRGNLRTLFNQFGVFLCNVAQLIHRAGQAGKTV